MIKLMAAITYVDQRTMRKIKRHELGFGGAGAGGRLALDCVGAECMGRNLLGSLLATKMGTMETLGF
jgi:hypothetical protein